MLENPRAPGFTYGPGVLVELSSQRVMSPKTEMKAPVPVTPLPPQISFTSPVQAKLQLASPLTVLGRL
jgi:hypothetical protein